MLGEDRGGGLVTSAEIEAVGEPLGCVVRHLIGPFSAHWRFAVQVVRAVVDGHDASVPTAGSHPS